MTRTAEPIGDGLAILQGFARSQRPSVEQRGGRLVPTWAGDYGARVASRVNALNAERLRALGWTLDGGEWGYPLKSVDKPKSKPKSKPKARAVKAPPNDR